MKMSHLQVEKYGEKAPNPDQQIHGNLRQSVNAKKNRQSQACRHKKSKQVSPEQMLAFRPCESPTNILQAFPLEH